MQLSNLSVAELVAGAGGDPWQINRTLQAGQPGQISNLANAFHSAGRSSAEADAAFDQARKRFEAAWNHQNGDSPINGSAEVQRTAQARGAQSQQGARDRSPDTAHPLRDRLVGTDRYHLLRIDTVGAQVRAVVCDWAYTSALDLGDGNYGWKATWPATDPAARIAVHQVAMTMPAGGPRSALPPQRGSAAAPVDDVFGGWHIVGHNMTADRVPAARTFPPSRRTPVGRPEACPDRPPGKDMRCEPRQSLPWPSSRPPRQPH